MTYKVPSIQVNEVRLIRHNEQIQTPFKWFEKEHPRDKRWKKGTHYMLYKIPYFFLTTGPNQTGSSLTDRQIVLIHYDFSNCNTISFVIDSRMQILTFGAQTVYSVKDWYMNELHRLLDLFAGLVCSHQTWRLKRSQRSRSTGCGSPPLKCVDMVVNELNNVVRHSGDGVRMSTFRPSNPNTK